VREQNGPVRKRVENVRNNPCTPSNAFVEYHLLSMKS
jgi:hypothetical protein